MARLFKVRSLRIALLACAMLGLTFTSASPVAAQADPAIVSPAAGSVLAGPSVLFEVDLNDIVLESSWFLVGSTPGGSEHGSTYVGTASAKTVTGLPTDGSSVYVTYAYKSGGAWATVSETYTAGSGSLAIVSPAGGSTLPGASALFEVDLSGVVLQSSWYFVGSTPGGSEHGSTWAGTATSKSLTGLPTDGSTMYVTYAYKSGGVWSTVSETYTAGSGSLAIVSPTPGSTLPGASALFEVDLSGVVLESSWYFVGSTPGGSEHGLTYAGTSTSTTLTGLPTDGLSVYVRYAYKTGGYWYSISEVYTGGGLNVHEVEIGNLVNELRTDPNGPLGRQGSIANCDYTVVDDDNFYIPAPPVEINLVASLQVARPWSVQMTRELGHRPEAGTLALEAAGLTWSTAGENVGWHNFPTIAMQHFVGWRESEGHFCNMMNPAFTQLGIGQDSKPNGDSMATQNFFAP